MPRAFFRPARDARAESGGDMRAAWHGLVHRLFPADVAAHAAVVDALRELADGVSVDSRS